MQRFADATLTCRRTALPCLGPALARTGCVQRSKRLPAIGVVVEVCDKALRVGNDECEAYAIPCPHESAPVPSVCERKEGGEEAPDEAARCNDQSPIIAVPEVSSQS